MQPEELRRQVFEMAARAGQGHLASVLSMVDILIALFYGVPIRFTPDGPRDRVIISKGHATMGIYPILADLGFFPKEELDNYGTPGALLKLFGNTSIPGIDATTGSLGHGVGIGCGYAMAEPDAKVYVILSEGEFYEGATWESIQFAVHHNLKNLVIIVDRNYKIILGDTEDCLKLRALDLKMDAFGFEARVVDGHSVKDMVETIQEAGRWNMPTAIIAETVKGKGLSFMEGKPEWHYTTLTPELIDVARGELQ